MSAQAAAAEAAPSENLQERMERRIARYQSRTYDWDALKFQADFDPKYRRAQMRIRSTKSKAIKEREELTEMQRSGEALEARQRERIETTVSQLAREVENMDRDMQLGRF